MQTSAVPLLALAMLTRAASAWTEKLSFTVTDMEIFEINRPLSAACPENGDQAPAVDCCPPRFSLRHDGLDLSEMRFPQSPNEAGLFPFSKGRLGSEKCALPYQCASATLLAEGLFWNRAMFSNRSHRESKIIP
jgi:hypothetical protein